MSDYNMYFYIKLYTKGEIMYVYDTFAMDVVGICTDIPKVRVACINEHTNKNSKAVLYSYNNRYIVVDMKGNLCDKSYEDILAHKDDYYNIITVKGSIQLKHGKLHKAPKDVQVLYELRLFNYRSAVVLGYTIEIELSERLDVKSMEVILKGVHTVDGETHIDNLLIPDFITIVEHKSFSNIESVGKITLGSGVKQVWTMSFAHMHIGTIILGKNLETLGYKAFERATIQSIQFNDVLELIDDLAFLGCKCDKFILPKSLKQLGRKVFAQSSASLIDLSETQINTLDHCELIGLSNVEIRLPKGLKILDMTSITSIDALSKVVKPETLNTPYIPSNKLDVYK